ncbi:MAG: SprB repeat-containing protein, partial [Bacteroidales bacterium]|nr:SprB repeat-containing protein [Bacteroidales bacterium]
PTIDPIADSTEYLDASCEFNLNDYTPLANVNDNCGSTSVTQNPPAGTTLSGHNNDTIVWIIVNDGNNNSDSTSFTVNVLDTISPIANAYNAKTFYLNTLTGVVSITPDSLNNGSNDNCSIINMTIDSSTFNCANVGNPLYVRLMVEDAAGNVHTDSTLVTIEYQTTPEINFELTSDTAICSGDNYTIEFVSNIDATSYNWTVNAHSSVITTTSGNVDPANGDYTLSLPVNNTSDTARQVAVTIVPTLYNLCDQSDTTIYFWVEPVLDVELSPQIDTICDSANVNIQITSLSETSMDLRFKYKVKPVFPDSVIIHYSNPTLVDSMKVNDIISDEIDNVSTSAQLVYFIVTPYLKNGGITQYCIGAPDTTSVWVEPTPLMDAIPESDTICNDGFTNISLSSASTATRDIRFRYSTIIPTNVTVTSGATSNLTQGFVITDSIHNNTNDAQLVQFIITAYTREADSDNEKCAGLSDTVDVWVEPTPRLSVSVSDTIYCDSNTVNITVTDITGSTRGIKKYNLTTTNAGGNVIGVQADGIYDITTPISNQLINISDTVQVVSYNFKARINNSNPAYCEQGTDTTLYIYVNPTPRISVIPADTIICDSGEVNISVNSLLKGVLGTEVYDLTTEYTGGAVTGIQADGEYNTGVHITDTLINLTNTVQEVKYTFKPRIHNPRGDDIAEYCSQGGDTTITIYVNPTPKLSVSTTDTIYCDSNEVNITVNDLTGLVKGTKVYQLTTSNAGGAVTGLQNTGEYIAGTAIRDTLINHTNQVQMVSYHFKARIRDDRTGSDYCSQGGDTTIYIYVNPTAKLSVNVADTIICDSSSVTLSVNDLIGTVLGNKVYSLTTSYTIGAVTGVESNGEFIAGTDINNTLINHTNDYQKISYTFKAQIQDPRGDNPAEYCSQGKDTTIHIYLEPTIRFNLISSTDTICNGESTTISVNSINTVTSGLMRWSYQLISTHPDVSLSDNADTNNLANDANITIDNVGDTARYATIKLVPYIYYPATSSISCAGIPDTFDVWIEPTPRLLSFSNDTICNFGVSSFIIQSPTQSTLPVRFRYTITPENNDSLDATTYSGGYVDNFFKGDTITEVFTNLSNRAQLARIRVYAYLVKPDGSDRCLGVQHRTANLFVEPTAKVTLSKAHDTLCNNLITDVALTSVTQPTVGVRFRYQVIPQNGGMASFTYESDTFDLTKGHIIADSLFNHTSQIQPIKIKVTPYNISGALLPKCDGISDSVLVQLTPDLVMQDSARTYIKGFNIDCNGRTNGAIYMYPTGGITKFGHYNYNNLSYTVNGAPVSGRIVDYLGAGHYTIEAEDYSGCLVTDTITLVEPTPLSVNIEMIDSVKCGSANGKFTVTKTGGTYFGANDYDTLIWNMVAGGIIIGDTVFGGNEGQYYVTLTDQNQCTAEDAMFVVSPKKHRFESVDDTTFYNGFKISCPGAVDGYIPYNISEYGNSYTYTIIDTTNSKTDTLAEFSELGGVNGESVAFYYGPLPEGNYLIEVKDEQNCIIRQTWPLHPPSAPVEIINAEAAINPRSGVNISCFGAKDGQISVDGSGGRGDYYYDWSTSNGEIPKDSTSFLEQIPAGDYSVKVDDGYCFDTLSFTIVQPPEIIVNLVPVETKCYGDSTGLATAIVSGGVPQNGRYGYKWSHSRLERDSVAENLPIGTYWVEIEDKIECTVSDTFTIEQPDSIQILDTIDMFNGFEISCNEGEDGHISTHVTGGVGDYSYQWLDENDSVLYASAEVFNLTAGTYDYTVMDGNGCINQRFYVLNEPTAIEFEFSDSNKICTVLGSASVSDITGGVIIGEDSYDINWSNGIYTSENNDLYPGTYIVSITDDNNCSVYDTAVIVDLPGIGVTIDTLEKISCFGNSDGSFVLNPTNAAFPVKYYVNSELTKKLVRDVSHGTYQIHLVDAHGCELDTSITMIEPKRLIEDFTIENIGCFSDSSGSITFAAIGGTQPYSFTMNEIDVTEETIEKLPAGDYEIQIIDKNNCISDNTVIIEQEEEIEVAISDDEQPFCPESANGEISLHITGGKEPYNIYFANNLISDESISELVQGNYNIRVVD